MVIDLKRADGPARQAPHEVTLVDRAAEVGGHDLLAADLCHAKDIKAVPRTLRPVLRHRQSERGRRTRPHQEGVR
ncbi:hypothetical protein [Streptomyces sp.]|uniref:hypothetical protein n=1 Tax=Streptomyces sp. TaxID=1931 RepID=UPI002D295997|nr:hypothetical protein [Streptomyces sp.]HZF90166.1 hypothetical protein [Streptomyces sp.]